MHVLYTYVERKTNKVLLQKIPGSTLINKKFTFLASNFVRLEPCFSFDFHNTIKIMRYQVKYGYFRRSFDNHSTLSSKIESFG